MKPNKFWIFGILLEFLFIQLSLAGPKDFDILLLAQQWGSTLCIQYNKGSNCYLPAHNDWTIHGIWPSKSLEKGPEDCHRDYGFKASDLKSIRNQLDSYWFSVHGPNAESFWKHEWIKHGTCSVTIPQLQSQLLYFKTGLSLNRKYNIKQILDRARILPGKNYPIKNIVSTLEGALGVSPQITCIRSKKKQYLQEVRICLDKSLQIISCVGHLKYVTNCDSKLTVEYPAK